MKEYICVQCFEQGEEETPDGKRKKVDGFAEDVQIQLDYYTPLGWELHSIIPITCTNFDDMEDYNLESLYKDSLRHQLLLVLVREKKEK